MKVLGIVAGRHGGNCEILVKEALLACQEAGAEVKMINLFDYHIEHCLGCEMCTMQMGEVEMGKREKYDGCVLKNKDDMDKIVNEMQTCNGVIIGVPTQATFLTDETLPKIRSILRHLFLRHIPSADL